MDLSNDHKEEVGGGGASISGKPLEAEDVANKCGKKRRAQEERYLDIYVVCVKI